MFRRELLEVLREAPASLDDLARAFETDARTLEADVRHLARSLRHEPWRLVVTPARCRKCGFRFGEQKLRKPGKCPSCRATWIEPPLVGVEPG